MNIENFKKIKEKLEQQKKENSTKIILYDERTRMSRVNSFHNNVQRSLVFSLIAYLPALFISSALIKNIGYISLSDDMFMLINQMLTVGSSFGVGTLINKLITKKYKTKERFKVFSKAKNDAEKLKEEINYEIKLEKVMYRNKTIDETINVMESNQEMLDKMSNQYDIKNKIELQTREEVEIKVDELSDYIKEQYNKLDILVTQKVLHDNFWKIRSKEQKITELIVSSILAVLTSMGFAWCFPYLYIKEVVANTSLSARLDTLLIYSIVSFVSVGGYMIKRNKDKRKVFDDFNLQLGEISLVDVYKKFEDIQKEKEKFMSSIEAQIRTISLAEAQLQENMIHLEVYANEENRTKVETKRKALAESENDEQSIQSVGHSVSAIPSGPKLVKKK